MAAKILVVDDDPNVQRLLQYTLKQEGYEVVIAADGAEGFRMWGAEAPDLIPLLGAGINNQGTLDGAPAELFEDPNSLNAGKFDIHDASVGQPVREQRLGFINGGTVDDAILLGAEARAKRLR